MTSDLGKRAAARRMKIGGVKGKGHPSTADMDYSSREWEFMCAIEAFKKESGKMFPTWSEALAVLDSIGYRQVA